MNCPLCSVDLETSALEAHLRFELRFPLYACSLCPVTFCAEDEAEEHFTGPFAKHTGVQVQLVGHPSDPTKRARLLELLRLARGGEETVQQRLSVCGHCRLLCREADFRKAQPPPYANQYFTESLVRGETVHDYSTDAADRLDNNIVSANKFSSEILLRESREKKFGLAAARVPNSRSENSSDFLRSGQFTDDGHREEDSPNPPFRFAAAVGSREQSHFASPAPEGHTQPTIESATAEQTNQEDHENDQLYHDEQELNEHRYSQPQEDKSEKTLQGYSSNSGENSNRTSHQAGWQGNIGRSDYELNKLYKSPNETETSSDAKQTPAHKFYGIKVKADAKQPTKKDSPPEGNSIRCRSCAARVRRKDAKVHATRLHLKKELYACRTCDFIVLNSDAGKINRHVKAVHGQTPGPDTVDASGLQKHAPVIEALIRKLFDL